MSGTRNQIYISTVKNNSKYTIIFRIIIIFGFYNLDSKVNHSCDFRFDAKSIDECNMNAEPCDIREKFLFI